MKEVCISVGHAVLNELSIYVSGPCAREFPSGSSPMFVIQYLCIYSVLLIVLEAAFCSRTEPSIFVNSCE